MSSIPNVNPSIETLKTDQKAAIDFVESFFSGKQQKAITNDEERRAMLEKLMVAQKKVDDVKRLASIEDIKAKIAKHNEIYPEQKLTAADLGLNVQVVIEREGATKTKRETKGPYTLKFINTEGQIDSKTVDNLLFKEPSVSPSFWAYCNFMKTVTIDRSPKKPSIFKRNDLIDITDDRLKAISKEYIDSLNK